MLAPRAVRASARQLHRAAAAHGVFDEELAIGAVVQRGEQPEHATWRQRVSDCGSERIVRRRAMLWTIFVILLVLWLLGVVSSYTLGGFIHILLVLALVVLVIQLVSGRRAV
jgi:hypothetical protein